jgi:hypothetical protein
VSHCETHIEGVQQVSCGVFQTSIVWCIYHHLGSLCLSETPSDNLRRLAQTHFRDLGLLPLWTQVAYRPLVGIPMLVLGSIALLAVTWSLSRSLSLSAPPSRSACLPHLLASLPPSLPPSLHPSLSPSIPGSPSPLPLPSNLQGEVHLPAHLAKRLTLSPYLPTSLPPSTQAHARPPACPAPAHACTPP